MALGVVKSQRIKYLFLFCLYRESLLEGRCHAGRIVRDSDQEVKVMYGRLQQETTRQLGDHVPAVLSINWANQSN